MRFFRDVLGLYPIIKEVLSKRMAEYKHCVEAFARNRKIPREWAQKGVRKEAQNIRTLLRTGPVPAGCRQTKIPGIKIQDTRLIRLLEILLNAGTQFHGWRTAQIHTEILATFGLSPQTCTLTQLRYDLRKLKAHGLLERDGKRYCYRLTEEGTKAALLLTLFHQRVCDPLANSLFHHRPNEHLKSHSQIETAYHKADKAIQQVIELLARRLNQCER